MSKIRFAFAGDRDIAAWVLDFLRGEGARPEALLLSGPDRASHADELVRRCSDLPDIPVLSGDEFRSEQGMGILRSLELDYIFCIHFPYLVPREVLDLPAEGVLNLHPAYLPFNRGWHTPSWALLEGTPIGATLHFMDEGLDTGDIVHQRHLEVMPNDTADTLYRRLKALELKVFREAWPALRDRNYARRPQDPEAGTMHRRKDLFADSVQRLDPSAQLPVSEVLLRLRALTTNQRGEAAYFDAGGRRYRVQVIIHEET
jgi:methionyl-tRNA formyltransferase